MTYSTYFIAQYAIHTFAQKHWYESVTSATLVHTEEGVSYVVHQVCPSPYETLLVC
jgi:hypothetical protein